MTRMTIHNPLYKWGKWTANALGYDMVMIKHGDKNGSYAPMLTGASYAPWLTDKEFNDVYGLVKENTLVDKYKCYALWQLVEQVSSLKGVIIEVGCWKGGSGILLAKKAELENLQTYVYLFDTFSGIVKAGPKDSNYTDGEHSNASKEDVIQLQRKAKIDAFIIKGVFPEDSSYCIKDDKIRLCHIDVDVYQSAKDAFEWVWKRVVSGGIVVFDDYGFQTCSGVRKFVDEIKDNHDNIFIHNLNGQAIIIKKDGDG